MAVTINGYRVVINAGNRFTVQPIAAKRLLISTCAIVVAHIE